MIIEKFRRTHPPTSGSRGETIPVLVVQMPPDPSAARFYLALLASMGAPIRPRQRVAELERVSVSMLRLVGHACWSSMSCTTSSLAVARPAGSS